MLQLLWPPGHESVWALGSKVHQGNHWSSTGPAPVRLLDQKIHRWCCVRSIRPVLYSATSGTWAVVLLLDFGSAFSMIIPWKLIGILIHMGVILTYMGVALIHMGVILTYMGVALIHMGVILTYMGVALIHMGVILTYMGVALIHMGVILTYMGVALIHMGVVRLSDPHGCHTDPHGCHTDPHGCCTIHMGVVLIYMGVILIHIAAERYLGMWLLDFFQARPQSVRNEKQDSKWGHSQHSLPPGMCALAPAVLPVHKSENAVIALWSHDFKGHYTRGADLKSKMLIAGLQGWAWEVGWLVHALRKYFRFKHA